MNFLPNAVGVVNNSIDFQVWTYVLYWKTKVALWLDKINATLPLKEKKKKRKKKEKEKKKEYGIYLASMLYTIF